MPIVHGYRNIHPEPLRETPSRHSHSGESRLTVFGFIQYVVKFCALVLVIFQFFAVHACTC